MKFGQGKELFSSVPSLINFFKTAVSKKKEPVPAPVQIPSSTSTDNRNRNSQNSSQNNGIEPVPVKRVSRFAPLDSSLSQSAATTSNTAANTSSSKHSFDGFLKKIRERHGLNADEQGGHNVDMEIDDAGGYAPPVPPRGLIPPPPSAPSQYQPSNQYNQ